MAVSFFFSLLKQCIMCYNYTSVIIMLYKEGIDYECCHCLRLVNYIYRL